MVDPKEDIILEFHDRGIIRFGDFALSSGGRSSFYINLRALPSFPSLFKKVVKLFVDKCLTSLNFDVVCGIATGGIPLAAYVAFTLDKPLVYVRKEQKRHGLQDLVVGNVSKQRILIVDDVATTGSSLVRATEYLKRSGGIVVGAGVIVLRGETPLRVLEKYEVELRYLLTAKEILSTLLKYRRITEDTYRKAVSELN